MGHFFRLTQGLLIMDTQQPLTFIYLITRLESAGAARTYNHA